MKQVLVIKKEYFDSLQNEKSIDILKDKNYISPIEFFKALIEKLNEEFNFLEISDYRFINKEESKLFSQYNGFIEGDELPFEKIIVFFTPLDSKLGNVIIEQSFMPTICKQMEQDIEFLLSNKYKKIAILTSHINLKNEVSTEYNKLQMDVNSLNTLNIDVIQFF